MAHKFDAKKAEILDSVDRRKFLNPESILGKAGLSRDTIFADLGCGSGYFAIPASLIVKKVYAIDVLFMANVFHELEDRAAILNEAKWILAGRGRLIIIDWKKMEMEMGPPVGERLATEEVVSICEDWGFRILERLEAGAYNYMLVFEKSAT